MLKIGEGLLILLEPNISKGLLRLIKLDIKKASHVINFGICRIKLNSTVKISESFLILLSLEIDIASLEVGFGIRRIKLNSTIIISEGFLVILEYPRIDITSHIVDFSIIGI